MRPALIILIWMLVILLPQSGSAQFRKKNKSVTSRNFSIQPIGPGIWAAIHNDDQGQSICNAGIVDLGDKVLIFDPFMNPSAAQELKALAEEMTGKYVGYVINSHFHNDHIRGNQVFSSESTIISTGFTRKEIERIEPAEQRWEEQHAPGLLQATKKRMSVAVAAEQEELTYWIGYYQGMVESAGRLQMTLPNITFQDSLWIRGRDRSVKLEERRNGHTASDAVLLIPDAGVIFMGDLLFAKRHPWLADGDPVGWQQSLQKYYEDTRYTTYIPGHGPVSGKETLKELYGYFDRLNALAKDAGSDSLQNIVLQSQIPEAFQHWGLKRFYHPNLQYLLNNRIKLYGALKPRKEE